jgi:hypothetical protein
MLAVTPVEAGLAPADSHAYCKQKEYDTTAERAPCYLDPAGPNVLLAVLRFDSSAVVPKRHYSMQLS